VTDANGAAVRCYDYLPFGEEIASGTAGRSGPCFAPYSSSPDIVSQKFTGKERDAETGLDYFGARYFSGAQGRFTSADPIHFLPQKILDPQQWNMYAYVRNNPLRLFDPSGLYTVDCPAGDQACTKAAARFEAARLKDLQSKKQNVKGAAAAWGGPTDQNGTSVTFKTQAQMDQEYGANGGGSVNGAVSVDQTSDHKPNIQAAFSESLGGSDLRRTIAHEGAHLEDDMAFFHSYDEGSGTFNADLNIAHYDTEFHAFEVGAAVKTYSNLNCGGQSCSVAAGPKGYQALDLYLRTNPSYVRNNNSLVFPLDIYPQRPPIAPLQ
jgi:RHS repeat-associated protein